MSIVLPVRNEEDAIAARITDFLAQDYPAASLELIVVDGRSTDGTIDIARGAAETHAADSHVQRIRILDNPERQVSSGLNIGIAAASGEIIVRWDGHTAYEASYVAQCVRILRESGAWNVGGPARTRAITFVQRAIASAYHSPFAVGGARFHDVGYAGPVDTVPYGCWWKRTLLDLGGFDEGLIRNQDDELNLRIHKRGGTVFQSPSIISWYSPRSSLRSLFKQYYQYGYWKVRVIRKHRLPASWRHLVPPLFVAGLLGGAGCSVFSVTVLWIWASVVVLYVCLVVFFSARAAALDGWRLLPLLPGIFMAFHVSYGLGFLSALFSSRGSVGHDGGQSSGRATSLSR